MDITACSLPSYLVVLTYSIYRATITQLQDNATIHSFALTVISVLSGKT
jgi:hypothetical protein